MEALFENNLESQINSIMNSHVYPLPCTLFQNYIKPVPLNKTIKWSVNIFINLLSEAVKISQQ